MDTILRTMSAEDYDQVYQLWTDSQGIGLHEDTDDSRAAIAEYLKRNPNLSFVACDEDGKIIGAVLCGHDGRRGSVNHLAVNKKYQGQRIGRQLMDACVAALKDLGIVKINMFVYKDNSAALKFYKQRGCVTRDDLLIVQEGVS